MLRRVLSLGLPAAIAVASACAANDEQPRVAISTNFTMPKGVLDSVTKVSLTVLEGAVACDEALGQIALPNGDEGAKEIARRELATNGCAAGVKFCGDITIEKSDTTRVFSAIAKGEGDAIIATGCTQAKVDQDALPLAFKMFRYLAPADCSDAVIQPTEQCVRKGANDPICDESCLSAELLLSVGSTQTGTQTGKAGDKTEPFLLWPQAPGIQGRFFAFYTDRAVAGSSNVEVALRAMSADLSPIGAAESPALAAGSIYLPNGPTFPAPPAPRQQSAPAAAFLNGRYYVVFQDDTGVDDTGQDIHLRSMDSALVAEQGASPLGINGGRAGTGGANDSGAGEPGIQGVPSIAAGPRDQLFVAWEDAASGKIVGRTLSPPSTLGESIDISSGTGNKGVSVAATNSGWVAVWQSGTGIKLRVINEDGKALGGEQTVNERGSVNERPRVASLADGRFAVVWSSGGDIFMQRYDTKRAKIAGDQASRINDIVKDGDQTTPSVAGTPAAGGSYVVAWLDVASSHVRARMLGGSAGFLFNSVNGQSTEFQASRSDGRTRANPAVAVGGEGPFVAIAWEDKSASGAGIVARRFPMPTE